MASEDRSDFRSKPAALAKVSSAVAAWLSATSADELFCFDITAGLTAAQQRRLDWAMGEVERRLWKMGRAS